jgi:short-subunit dehydrogenase
MNLVGRKVLVTGAAGGIGSALVPRLLDLGAHVLLTGRDRRALQRVAMQFDFADDRVECVEADLTRPVDIERLCAIATQWQGGVDVVINNAGVSEFGLLVDRLDEEVERSLRVNLIAPIELSRRLMPHLLTKPDAYIVNIGSVFGSIGYAGNSLYCAGKFGLRGFSEALRRELADTSVRVHHFSPRATKTAINSGPVDELNAALGNTVDDPAAVADQVIDLLVRGRTEATLGWPEKFFARLNAVLPGMVDAALRKQLPLIKRYAGRLPVAAQAHRKPSAAATKVRRIG